MTFGEQLKQLREEHEISARMLEEFSGVSKTVIYYIEKGRRCPTIETANKLLAPFRMELGIIKKEGKP